jgi:hypothetical protein
MFLPEKRLEYSYLFLRAFLTENRKAQNLIQNLHLKLRDMNNEIQTVLRSFNQSFTQLKKTQQLSNNLKPKFAFH